MNFNSLVDVTNSQKYSTQLGSIGSLSTIPFTTSNLTATVATGSGYISIGNIPNDELKYVTWDPQTISLPANSQNHLYIDQNGIFQQSNSESDSLSIIDLGDVHTGTGSSFYNQNSGRNGSYATSYIDNTLRYGFGPIVSSGLICTPSSSTGSMINVTSGTFFFSTRQHNLPQTLNINMITFYRDTFGGYISNTTSHVSSQWDNNSGVLQTVPVGQYVKHTLYIVDNNGAGNPIYLLVFGQQTFSSLASAQVGPSPTIPSFISEDVPQIAGVIVTNDILYGSVIPQDGIIDQRPTLSFRSGGSVTATSDHHSLSNLTTGDDHPQYFRTDGTRIMGGNINMGGNNLVSVNSTVNNVYDLNATGMNIFNHANRHVTNGSDPLPVSIPVSIGTVNSLGIAHDFAVSDHVHAHDNQPGGSLHSAVTQSVNGFMTSADKIKLDSATGSNISNTLVIRDSNGSISINNITGVSASFTNIRTNNITGVSAFLTNLGTNNITGVSASITNITTSNITGVSAFLTNLGTNNITGVTASFTNITGTNAFLTNLGTNNITGVTASFTNITGTNAFLTNLGTNNITGVSSSFTNITASNITGANAFLTNLGTNNITGVSALFTNSTHTNLFVTNVTGTNGFITNLKATTIDASQYLINGISLQITGPTGPGFTYKGAWNSITTYSPTDVVLRNSTNYISNITNTNIDPALLGAYEAMYYPTDYSSGTTQNAGGNWENGMYFSPLINGFISGVVFFKYANNIGTHTGKLWTSGGVLLNSVVFSGESTSGYQIAYFTTPTAVTAGTTYVVSCNVPNGATYWTTFQSFPINPSPNSTHLRVTSSGQSFTSGVFPNQGGVTNGNLGIDVQFSSTSPWSIFLPSPQSSSFTNLITTNFTGTNAFLTNLGTNNITGVSASITNITTSNITGTNAFLTNLGTNNITGVTASVTTLNADHIVGTTLSPTLTINAGVVVSSSSIAGSDISGVINFVVTGGTNAGQMFTVTFNKPYNVAPKAVIISPASATFASLAVSTIPFIASTNITINGFTITQNATRLPNGTYAFYYLVL
ncbi:MAG: DUF4082 domain-containing protein [Candidatus Colwellbacteria bacterium]|nr:DUF4082 domain-containing protein [Candidatus Colwellbacteria bacterium]